MELRQLELFVAIAEEGQFTRAAARCHIAQSALSVAIRTLERDLGTTLFTRTTRRVQLTGAGLALLPEARRTLASAELARSSVQEVGALLRGSLSIGGIATPGTLDQAAALAEFRRRHPALKIQYVRDTSWQLIDRVRNGALDAALVTLPKRLPTGVDVAELATEPLNFVCRTDHRLAQRQSLTIADLACEEFVGAPAGTLGADNLERIFDVASSSPTVSFEVNDIDTLLDFVANGLGVTLVQETIARSRPGLCAIPVLDPGLRWTLVVVTSSRERVAPAARAFIEMLQSDQP